VALTSVTLSYSGKLYTFKNDEQALKGRLGCDCGKSWLIRAACDPNFPVLKCGADIAVIRVVDSRSARHTPA
jgi:hypothetical protein